MGSPRTSRVTPCVFRAPLLVLILSLEVLDTEAAGWGWLGGSDKDSEGTTYGNSETEEVRFGAGFELDSMEVLGSRGRELYEQHEKSVSLTPSGRTCWQKAYGGMQTGCREILNDEAKKSRLALRLTDCFLITSGRDPLKNCPNSVPIVTCVRVLDDHDHSIFLAFFVDIAAMCHFLQSEEFKLETERAVILLKDSTDVTQGKLETMNVHLDAQHSTIMEHTGYILEAQEILQKGHEALQDSIQQGMEKMQETSLLVRSGLEDVHGMQKDVARKHEELSDVMTSELSALQEKSDSLANSLASVYGSVEDLAEQSQTRREEAKRGLTDLQGMYEDVRKQTKQDLQRLSNEALKVYDEYQGWQAQLRGTHETLAESAAQITKGHDTILSRQSQVNKLIMDVLEALMAIQKGWIFESRLLRSAGAYVGACVAVYIVTTTKKTRSARLSLYIGLFGTLVCEIYLVHYGVEHVLSKENKKESDSWLPSNVGLLRYTACALALGFLLYSYYRYKDYKVLNNKMLDTLLKEVKYISMRQGNIEMRQGNMENALGISELPVKSKSKRQIRPTRPIRPIQAVQSSPY